MTDRYSPFAAAAIDLDGTLLSDDKQISRANRAAVEDLTAHGVRVILASGRHRQSMLRIARTLPEVEWLVSSQGAHVADVEGRQVVYERHMPVERVAHAVDIGLRHAYATIAYAREGIFTVSGGPWVDHYARLSGVRPTRVPRAELLLKRVFKVVFIDEPARIDAAERLPDVLAWPLYRVRSLREVMELAGLGTTKADGLKALLGHLGLSAERLMAFGDAPNDAEMLELAGYSVAMNHAWDAAKRAADAVAPDGPPEEALARAVDLVAARATNEPG